MRMIDHVSIMDQPYTPPPIEYYAAIFVEVRFERNADGVLPPCPFVEAFSASDIQPDAQQYLAIVSDGERKIGLQRTESGELVLSSVGDAPAMSLEQAIYTMALQVLVNGKRRKFWTAA